MNEMLDFRSLGRIDLAGAVEGAGDPSALLSQPKPTALFVYLLLARPGALQRRDALAAMLWPESDQKRARGALSQTLYVIRRHLGPQVLVTRGTEEVGIAEGVIRVDTLEFQRLLEAGETEAALELYGGELLPSFYLPDTPSFEHWLDGERARLRRTAAGAAWDLVEERETAGDGARASYWARRAARIAPHDEAGLRRLMSTLRRLGDRAGALAEFERYRKRLAGEMELEPESETSALAAEIEAEGKRGEGPAVTIAAAYAAEPDTGVTRSPHDASGRETRFLSPIRRLAGAVAALVIVVGGYAVLSRTFWPPAPDLASGETVPSVAVLPIRADSQLSEQVTRRLIETLQRAGVRTQGWMSVSRFATGQPNRAIADRLGVDYLVEGLAARTENRIELTASLTDARDGSVLWSETLTGASRDLRDLEIRVAQATVDHITEREGRDPAAFPVRRYTRSAEADSLYRLGRYLLAHSYNPVTTRRASEAFRGAIEVDSAFAPAYLGLADALLHLSRVFWDREPREQVPEVLDLLMRAERLEPGLADSYTWMGWYLYGYAREYERALSNFADAIRLAPSNSEAHVSSAFVLMATNRTDSALAMTSKARGLEPLNPLIVSTHCWMQYLADRLEEAIETCSFVTDSLDASYKVAKDIPQLASYLLMARRGDSAGLAAARRALAASPTDQLPGAPLYFELGPAYFWALVGDTARAISTLEQERTEPRVRPLRMATNYAAVGQMDSAFAWLDRAIEARDPYVPEIGVRPAMERFRQDPRFLDYLERLRLASYFPEYRRAGE